MDIPQTPAATEPDGHHRAARRSMEIIEVIADSDSGLSLSELARRSKLPKTTAHALLQTLSADGFLDRAAGDGRYTLGPRLLRLLGRLPDQFELPRLARPLMENLVREVGETAILGVRRGAAIVYIEQVETTQYIRYSAPIGEARPLYASSIGKLFTAAMPEAALRQVLREAPPVALTEATTLDAEVLMAEARDVAARGYAVNRQETIAGVLAIAAPVRPGGDPEGPLLAGVSVCGPVDRLAPRLDAVRPLMVEAALQIGQSVTARHTSAGLQGVDPRQASSRSSLMTRSPSSGSVRSRSRRGR